MGDDLSESDIDDMIADVDTDGSGWVDYEGLIQGIFILCITYYSLFIIKQYKYVLLLIL